MSGTLSYPIAEVPPSGVRHRVADGVYWLRFPLPFALDHINLWLLEDNGGWTVVDTGLGVRPSQKIWKGLLAEQLDGKPLTRVIVTHYHPDHLGLAGWLEQETGAEVWISRGEWALANVICDSPEVDTIERLRGFLGGHGLSGDDLDKVAGKGNGFRRVVQPLPSAPGFLSAGDVITINGDDWAVHVGCGHSPEHVCLYRDRDHLLISGDQVLPTISSNLNVRAAEPDADPVTDFVDSLKALRDKLPDDTLVLPAHGLPFRGLRARVDALALHHDEQLDRVQAACRERPQSAFDMLPVLFDRKLDVQQLMFAMGESIAHLNCLMQQGRVQREQVEGIWRFRG
ncbi:MBL fold metallo-hydrolase [Alcanivorax sp. S6407]|uniref:MBL fold metallo-hydrolase n=1 Tax=Alcanivorax sp. S6407 TaxID=2926424 RepID=UPI001FF30C26|nr:MBL fold metallo-hydrolase [Alcanivorax sp. S6407]MCK0152108.1 MBL fold metallo-hydrolase [Alcanivorax sp. S6407]